VTLYVARRLAFFVPALILASVAVFGMIHLLPGDPVEIMLQGTNATAEQIAALRSELGLDRPLPEQYVNYMSRVVSGDFGRSIRTGSLVLNEFAAVFPNTLALALAAMAIAMLIGLGLGIVAGTRPGGLVDAFLNTFCLIGVGVPPYLLCMVAILVFALTLRWLPATGEGGWNHLILPAIALGWSFAAILARLTRSSLIEVMSSDYILTARAKGLGSSKVLRVHALRNALIPVVTILGIQFGVLLGGAVIVETVFARRGVGRLLVDGILSRDFPMVQGIVLILAAIFLLVNLAVDVVYGVLDPRLRRAA
jgi:peptide/nickel transport system permease protein/oligopeptide transport system permease protein